MVTGWWLGLRSAALVIFGFLAWTTEAAALKHSDGQNERERKNCT